MRLAILFDIFVKNDGYAFLMRLDLILSMSLWKGFQFLQILNELSTKHLIKSYIFNLISKMWSS